MIKIKVAIRTKEKSVTRVFSTERTVVLSEDDGFIKDCVSEVLKDFDTTPDKIKVSAALDL